MLRMNLHDDMMLEEISKDLTKAQEGMQSSAKFQSEGWSMMKSAAHRNFEQRSNQVDSMMETGAEEQSAYATSAKKRMMKNAKSKFGMS
jgi:hypothetical protein